MIYLILWTVVVCIALIIFVLIEDCSTNKVWIFKKDINSADFNYLLDRIKKLEERMDKTK